MASVSNRSRPLTRRFGVVIFDLTRPCRIAGKRLTPRGSYPSGFAVTPRPTPKLRVLLERRHESAPGTSALSFVLRPAVEADRLERTYPVMETQGARNGLGESTRPVWIDSVCEEIEATRRPT